VLIDKTASLAENNRRGGHTTASRSMSCRSRCDAIEFADNVQQGGLIAAWTKAVALTKAFCRSSRSRGNAAREERRGEGEAQVSLDLLSSSASVTQRGRLASSSQVFRKHLIAPPHDLFVERGDVVLPE
jgi:hypothetical protein